MQTQNAGIGFMFRKNVYTNDDLKKYMDTSDEWIQERTGIKERRYADRLGETTTTMGVGSRPDRHRTCRHHRPGYRLRCFATLSPDYYFPGCGVLLQQAMKMKEVGAWIYATNAAGLYTLSVADQFIKTGICKNILVVGAENIPSVSISAPAGNVSDLWRWSRRRRGAAANK